MDGRLSKDCNDEKLSDLALSMIWRLGEAKGFGKDLDFSHSNERLYAFERCFQA